MFNIFTFRELVSPLVVQLLNSEKPVISQNGDVVYGTFRNISVEKVKAQLIKNIPTLLQRIPKTNSYRTLILGTCRPSENIAIKIFQNLAPEGKELKISEELDFWYSTEQNIILDLVKLNNVLNQVFFSLFSRQSEINKIFGTENTRFVYLSGYSANVLFHYLKKELIPERSIILFDTPKGFLCDCNDLFNRSVHLNKIPTCEHELLKSQIF